MSDDNGTAMAVAGGNEVTEVTQALLNLARDKDLNISTFQALMEMQERLEARQAKRAYNEAFSRLEPNLPRISKRGEVQYPVDKNRPDGPKKTAFKYAKWEDVDAAVRPVLREHGFHLLFNTVPRVGDGGGLTVIGKLKHLGGHEETASFTLPLDTSGGKSNLQGYASSTSFGQRYVTKMLLNLIFEEEDDDGVKGGMEFINDEQIGILQDLMTKTRTNPDALLRGMGFTELHEIGELETRDFARVRNALELKLRKAKA